MPALGTSDPLAISHDAPPASARRADLAWGVRQGTFYAAAFSILGVVAFVVGDDDLRKRIWHGAVGCLAVYWITGILGGLLVGACRRALARLGVALLVGWAIGTLFIGAIEVWAESVAAFADWRTWAMCAGVGAVVGMFTAGLRWSRARQAGAADGAPAV